MTDEEAEAILGDGHCPLCEAAGQSSAIELHEGSDADDEGRVFPRHWFECTGPAHHHYPAEYESSPMGGFYYAVWEGEEAAR